MTGSPNAPTGRFATASDTDDEAAPQNLVERWQALEHLLPASQEAFPAVHISDYYIDVR